MCTPGGTTIYGLHALEQGGLRATAMSAVEAATCRARELSRSRCGHASPVVAWVPSVLQALQGGGALACREHSRVWPVPGTLSSWQGQGKLALMTLPWVRSLEGPVAWPLTAGFALNMSMYAFNRPGKPETWGLCWGPPDPMQAQVLEPRPATCGVSVNRAGHITGCTLCRPPQASQSSSLCPAGPQPGTAYLTLFLY